MHRVKIYFERNSPIAHLQPFLGTPSLHGFSVLLLNMLFEASSALIFEYSVARLNSGVVLSMQWCQAV